MAHLHSGKSRFEKTDPRWLKAGGQLSEIANSWSGRDDIISFLGEGAADGSAGAAFNPDLAEMEVNVKAAFGEGADPEWMGDLRVRDVQFDHTPAIGAVLHEAMHAKHSAWSLRECAEEVLLKGKDPFAHALVTDFEESRIEARGVEAMPHNRAFLRACALRLVLGDIKEDEGFAGRGHQSMSKLMLLSMARVDAGVLEDRDVRPIEEAARKLYGDELVEKLRALWVAAQAHRADEEWRPLHELALEWIRLLEEAGHEPRKENEVPDWVKELLQAMAGPPGGEGEGEDGEGGGAPSMIVVMAGETETRAQDEANKQAAAEQAAEAAAKAAEAAKEQQQHEQTSKEVFGRGTGPGPAQTASRLIERRAPTGPERAAAVALAKALERAQYRDREVTRVRAATPPGRLRMGAVLAAEADRARGGMAPSEPWRGKRRRQTDEPKLTVGLLTDISGSMHGVMVSTAVTSWVMSEAVRRVQGTAAQVYYGNDVFPTLAPGQHADEVVVYSASDMTERFDKGFKALNGRLRLLGGTGARLLVVVSDLYHQGSEREAAKRWFARCRRDGVAVVVVAPDERMVDNARTMTGQNGTVVKCDPNDPVSLARIVGEAAIKELRAASAER